MRAGTALIAVAAAAGVAAAAEPDYNRFSWARDNLAISTAGTGGSRTTYYADCPETRTNNGCIIGEGATVVKGPGGIDMVIDYSTGTISQHCTYSAESAVCTAAREVHGSTSTLTGTVPQSVFGLFADVTETASVKASPAPSTATATSTSTPSAEGASSDEQSSTQTSAASSAESTTSAAQTTQTSAAASGTSTAQTTQTTENVGMQATEKAWAVGGVAMAVALVVA